MKPNVLIRYLPIPAVIGAAWWLHRSRPDAFAWLMPGIGSGIVVGAVGYALIQRKFFKKESALVIEAPVEPKLKAQIIKTPEVPKEETALDFLKSVEVQLRRLSAMKNKPKEVENFLRSLEREHGIAEVDESIDVFTDDLVNRYRLDESLGPDRVVCVWEPYWKKNDTILFKGTLRTRKNGNSEPNA